MKAPNYKSDKPKLYVYYVKLVSEEHMLYRKEIAELYGLYTMKGAPHSRLITCILNEYASIQKQIYPEFFWNDIHFQVWPREQYHPAMQWFIETVNRTNSTQYTFSDGQTQSFSLTNPTLSL